MRSITNKYRATLAVSCLALCQAAAAVEPVDALADHDRASMESIAALASFALVATEALDMLHETARKAHADRDETTAMLRPLDIERTSMPEMIERMIELEALPFVKVSEKGTHRLYFGISFDGVLGLHGNF